MRSSPDSTAPRRESLRRIAVVGAGLAGLRTSAALREAGFRGEITVLGAEGLAPYDRPPLSKELFARTEPAWLDAELGSNLFALADRVELATPVRSIAPADSRAGAVRLGLAEGEDLVVDVAVAASGAHAAHPPAWAEARVLRTAPDAAVLREVLTPGTRLVCIGAGWIGAEVSGVAAAHGCEVVVLEQAATPLARELGPEVGALTAPWFTASGVSLHVGTRVTSVHADVVHVADGRAFPADVVLAAVGARPSTDWCAETLPLTDRRAIATDRFGAVTAPGFSAGTVRAVGDCADRLTPRDGWVRGGHWASALHDPDLVATAILGGPVPPADPAAHTFSSQHGHELALFGQPTSRHRVLLRGDPEEGSWTALYVEPGDAGEAVLAGGFTVDAPRDTSALRRLLGLPRRPVLDLRTAVETRHSLRDAVRG